MESILHLMQYHGRLKLYHGFQFMVAIEHANDVIQSIKIREFPRSEVSFGHIPHQIRHEINHAFESLGVSIPPKYMGISYLN
ncbi:hypothetical protein HYT53_01840 [Candidatus Woesearchaeota archaeon]|nr:hypothetical protein [Candidatus Woesearchaeota archaeon]